MALGELLIGTVAALGAVVEDRSWSSEVAVIAVGGVGLTFGLWWTCFMVPAGQVLRRQREKSFVWDTVTYSRMDPLQPWAPVSM